MSNITGTFPVGIKPLGYQQLTVADSSVGLTVPAGAQRAVLDVEAQPLRWRDDGTDPTATVGTLRAAGDVITLYGPESIEQFRAIRSGETSAKLNIAYYG